MEERRKHLPNVSLFLFECLGHAIHQSRRWIVRNEPLRQFQRDEVRGLPAGRQHVQHLPALVLAFGLDAMSKDKLWARLVHAWIELECSNLKGLFDGPTGK